MGCEDQTERVVTAFLFQFTGWVVEESEDTTL